MDTILDGQLQNDDNNIAESLASYYDLYKQANQEVDALTTVFFYKAPNDQKSSYTIHEGIYVESQGKFYGPSKIDQFLKDSQQKYGEFYPEFLAKLQSELDKGKTVLEYNLNIHNQTKQLANLALENLELNFEEIQKYSLQLIDEGDELETGEGTKDVMRNIIKNRQTLRDHLYPEMYKLFKSIVVSQTDGNMQLVTHAAKIPQIAVKDLFNNDFWKTQFVNLVKSAINNDEIKIIRRERFTPEELVQKGFIGHTRELQKVENITEDFLGSVAVKNPNAASWILGLWNGGIFRKGGGAHGGEGAVVSANVRKFAPAVHFFPYDVGNPDADTDLDLTPPMPARIQDRKDKVMDLVEASMVMFLRYFGRQIVKTNFDQGTLGWMEIVEGISIGKVPNRPEILSAYPVAEG